MNNNTIIFDNYYMNNVEIKMIKSIDIIVNSQKNRIFNDQLYLIDSLIEYSKNLRNYSKSTDEYLKVFFNAFQHSFGLQIHQLSETEMEIYIENNVSEFVSRVKYYLTMDFVIAYHMRMRKCFEKNRRSLTNFIHDIFDESSTLLVIRLDLGYYKGAFDNMYEMLETMMREKELFIKYLRGQSFEKTLLHYVWKVEYGEDKGAHLHTILFLDGQKMQNDVYYAKQFGEYWKNEITKGRGIYYNCNALKQQYHHLAIGKISYNDHVLIQNLIDYVAKYITKPDPVIRYIGGHDNKQRYFGKSEVSSMHRGTPRVGRPRQYTRMSD